MFLYPRIHASNINVLLPVRSRFFQPLILGGFTGVRETICYPVRLRGAIQTTGEGCRSRDSGVHIVRLLQAVMTSMMKELKKRMSTEGGGEGKGGGLLEDEDVSL